MEALRTLEEFPRYLAYILSTSNDLVARIVSGITLKNVVKQRQGEISPEAYQQIYECSFSSFSDPELSIRNVAGNIVSTVLRYKFEFWPGAVDALLECMDGGNQFAAEGAFSALCKVCEDAFLSIETTDKGLSLRVVNKLISLLNNPIPRIRADSISALENFIFHRSQSMITNMRSFLNSILQLTADESLIVRTAVCKTLTIILEVSHEDLVPDMNFIMDFMCQCLNSDDCDLAMRGFGFWLECVKTPELRDHLETCLPRLVGLLVKRMSFTEEYIANYEAEDDDCEEEDQDKDIKPHHHKTIVHKHPQNEQTRRGNEASSRLTELQHDDDSDSSMDNDDDDDMFPGWSLRKCASITLDILTTIFDNELLAHIRPHLMRELNDSNWVHQECGILVLGTISSCRNPLLIEDFSKLFPFLFSSLKSPHVITS